MDLTFSSDVNYNSNKRLPFLNFELYQHWLMATALGSNLMILISKINTTSRNLYTIHTVVSTVFKYPFKAYTLTSNAINDILKVLPILLRYY